MTERKTALVTGANKGIGFEVAAQLGELGFRVGVGARDAARGTQAVERLLAAGVDAFAVALDVADDESVRAAAAGWTGGLDVLVNNAGISGGAQDPASRTSPDQLRAVLDTNVVGVLRVTNAFLPLLRRSDAPRIVNVSSSMGSLTLQHGESAGSGPVGGAYGPSKSLLNALTLQYARELRDSDVLVNAVCPGYTATDFTGHAGDRTPAQGARIVVELATVGDDGPRGGFFDENGVLPW
ncbi:SDR family oxidoreductase [Kineococcus rhizosphaerae]|uniref:Short-subunit dehydrogenase n=1 Tax=Kineococcus rhizosphaerae TaxID=559628 RepID=A0A2T0R667_9ACTN|nr:SDR family oxidoreductase [Kineococcus rhizosphaerae]PRY16656.1 short-subunit dehydrogenase [Kineococcus rhizosphaerae]